MGTFKETVEESKAIWETNADFWDSYMGDESNVFHREIVRPPVEKLLQVQPGDYILDIACGTGNFSARMAEQGAEVVAFDFSEKMIAHAKKRRRAYLDKISFSVCDATDYASLMTLKGDRKFDKAVSLMAIMDIAHIEPLFRAVAELLRPQGIFVLATHHPCFQRPADKYLTSCLHKGEAVRGQPMLQNYYHRSLQDIFNLCFTHGFVIDGFYEEKDTEEEVPVIMIVRARKSPHNPL